MGFKLSMKLIFTAVIVIFSGTYAFSADKSFSKALKKISLPVGESITLSLPPTANLNISRKGTIDIFAVTADSWVVTALRSGHVMIEVTYPNEPDPKDIKGYPRRIFIQCIKPTKKKSKSIRLPGKKVTSSFSDLNAYQLHLKIISTNASHINQLGIDYSPEKFIAFATRSISVDDINHLLSDHRGHLDTKVESEPMFRLMEGQKANIALGGETAYTISDGHDGIAADWKQSGLQLEAEIHRAKGEDQRMLSYTFALRTGAQGHYDKTLNLSQMQSDVLVNLGQPMILGILSLQSNKQSERDSFFLGHIPIVGPLLKATRHEHDAKKLIIMVNIIKDTPALHMQPIPAQMRDESN